MSPKKIRQFAKEFWGNGGTAIVGIEYLASERPRLFAPIVTDSGKDPCKEGAVWSRFPSEMESLPDHRQGIAMAPKVGKDGTERMESETASGLMLGNLAGHLLGPDSLARDKVGDGDLAPGVDLPVPSVLRFGLSKDLSCRRKSLQLGEELAGVLTLELLQTAHGLVRLPGVPQVLGDADRAMVTAGLLTVVQRGPVHDLGKVGAGLVVRPERLAFPSCIEVRGGDGKRIGLAPKEDRAKPAEDPRPVHRLRAPGSLVGVVPDARLLARNRLESIVDLPVSQDRHGDHDAGNRFGHVGALACAPETLDLGKDLSEYLRVFVKNPSHRLLGRFLRGTPRLEEQHRDGDLVYTLTLLFDRGPDSIPCPRRRVDVGEKGALGLEEEIFVRDAPKRGEELGRDANEERRRLLGGDFGVYRREHLPRLALTALIAHLARDLDEGFEQWPDPVRIPGTAVEGTLKSKEDELSGLRKIVHEARCPRAPGMGEGKRESLATGPLPLLERCCERGELSAVQGEPLGDCHREPPDKAGLVPDTEPAVDEALEAKVEIRRAVRPVGELEGSPGLLPEFRTKVSAPLFKGSRLIRRERDTVAEGV